MAHSKLDELKLDLTELAKLSKLAERQRVKDICVIETRKLETEIAKIQDIINTEKSPQSENPKPVVAAVNRCYDVKLTNYAWDQSDKFVKIFITINNVQNIPEENVHCDFGETSVELVVKALENRNYLFSMKNLLEKVDVGNSKWKVKKDMVVIFLSKTKTNMWGYLTTVDKKAKEPKSKLPEMNSNEEPQAQLMNMMRQMYEDGDDDMKRTIAQSWAEGANKSGIGGF